MQGKSQMLQQGATATGTGIPIILNGAFGSLALQVWGTFVGTINFEITINGTDWVPANGVTTSTTTPGVFYFSVNGIMQLRANITTYTSGTINVMANALEAASGDDGLVQLTSNFAQKSDVVSTDTVVTAGTNVLYTASGGQSFTLDSGKRQIASGFLLASSGKSKLTALFYSQTYPSTSSIKETLIVDNTTTAAGNGAGIVAALTNRYILRYYNTDATDQTIKVLTRAEVS